MKAYQAWDEYNSEGYSTVIFAESASKARAIAFHSEALLPGAAHAGTV